MRLKRLHRWLIPNQLERLRLRARHGVMREDNYVYEMLRRYPPPGEPAHRELKELKFPWDDLEDEYRDKQEAGGYPNIVPVEDPNADPAMEFAQRQWRRMKNMGLTKEEAFKKVMKEYEEERQNAMATIKEKRKDFRQWHRGEMATPLNPKQFQEWTKLSRGLELKPWTHRKTEEKVVIDSWLATAVLGWRWRLERIFDEEASFLETWGLPKTKDQEHRVALALEMARLRRDAFWPLLTDPYATSDEDDPLDTEDFTVEFDPDDDDDDEHMVDATFDMLQERAEARTIDAWTKDEVAELDAYLARAFHEGLVVIDPSHETKIDNSLPIERLRLEVFPELCPTHQKKKMYTEKSPVAEETDRSSHPTYDPDGQRLLMVRTTKNPKDIPRALARDGIFPEIDIDAVLEADLAKPEHERIIPEKLAGPLRAAKHPDSYTSQSIVAARRALRNERFLDRIYTKLHQRPELTLLDDEPPPPENPFSFADEDPPPAPPSEGGGPPPLKAATANPKAGPSPDSASQTPPDTTSSSSKSNEK